MILRDAVRKYNMNHPRSKISVANIAQKFGISRQALWELSDHGGKNGLNKYKDKFFEFYPEIANDLSFPKRMSCFYKDKVERKVKKVKLSEKDRAMILNYDYLFGASTLKKAREGGMISERILQRHYKLMEMENIRLESLSRGERGLKIPDFNDESKRDIESDTI